MKKTLASIALALSLSVAALEFSVASAAAESTSGGPVVVTSYAKHFGLAIFKNPSDPVELQKQMEEWLKSNTDAVLLSTQLQYLGNYYVLSITYSKR